MGLLCYAPEIPIETPNRLEKGSLWEEMQFSAFVSHTKKKKTEKGICSHRLGEGGGRGGGGRGC